MEYIDKIQNKTWRAIYKVIITIQRFIGILLCLAVPAIVVYQVILRYVLKAPLMGIEELLVFFIIWLYMIGGSVASEQRTHITCGILTLYMKKEGTIKLFNVAKSLFGIIVGGWLTYWGYWYFDYSLNLWKTSDILHIPMFYAESAIFIGFALMLFFGALELIENVTIYILYLKEKGGKK